jgi:hypothetical protein
MLYLRRCKCSGRTIRSKFYYSKYFCQIGPRVYARVPWHWYIDYFHLTYLGRLAFSRKKPFFVSFFRRVEKLVAQIQGDQMSLCKNRQKCSPTHFLSKSQGTQLLLRKIAQNLCHYSNKKLSKVNICTYVGEKWPNLVTLLKKVEKISSFHWCRDFTPNVRVHKANDCEPTFHEQV